ncbi:toxic anion resistance protein [Chachezhania sediminis]|uniref:toxic anion resistance protein n=1 Tax=Chachezhania sediminis TaxID=2599291 RepID=UPI00131E4E04|nr:toxic anion resistance protein [Chachezhania sediminis]
MSETIQKKAAEAVAEVEQVAASQLPVPAAADEIVTKQTADAPVSAEIERRMAEIDMGNTGSIISFGSRSQAELQQISQDMLNGVRNKDIGPAGDSLREIVSTIRGFSVEELDPNRKPSFWERLMGKAGGMAQFAAKFETVQTQIDKITDELLGHEHALLKDIKSLDLLYEKTLVFYDELALYIAAGHEKLDELDSVDIPALAAAVDAAPEDEQVIKAQELRDLRAARDDLERRVHDLKLTRQVTMQSLPSIRLVQENDKSLVTKINSTLVNTVPLWETQLAQAVTIQRSAQATKAVKDATDLTNDLLKANAANLRETNKKIRTEMERGVFDIEAVKQANADLIGTIQESLQIADEGKAKRAAAEVELQKMERDLRDTLAAAKARGDGVGDNSGTSVPG